MADKPVYTFKNLDFNHFDDNFDFGGNWQEDFTHIRRGCGCQNPCNFPGFHEPCNLPNRPCTNPPNCPSPCQNFRPPCQNFMQPCQMFPPCCLPNCNSSWRAFVIGYLFGSWDR